MAAFSSPFKYKLKTITVSVACDSAKPPPVDCSAKAVDVIRAMFKKANWPWNQENFGFVALDSRGHPIAVERTSLGTKTACLVHPADIFRRALLVDAVEIIAFHNHPSGEVTPSWQDKDVSRRLCAAGDLLGIPVVDNLIITATDHRVIDNE